MAYANPDCLVSSEWLAARLGDPGLRVVDATWFLPNQGRDARAEYDKSHIPGAVFFDIDEIADGDSPLPHMLPGDEAFSDKMGGLGVGDDVRVVVYDRHGLMSAARVWWTFRAFGHGDVAVLDGGFPKWVAENRPTESQPPVPQARKFTARLNHRLVSDIGRIRANLDRPLAQILDARPVSRFEGKDPEPRPGLRAGHIPGSLNLPFDSIINPETKTVLPADELAARFEDAGIDMINPVITTCGSGITACVLAFGLHLIGHEKVSVYDGSWAEWGGREDTPVAP